MNPTQMHKLPGFQRANPVMSSNYSVSWQQLCVTASTKENVPESFPPAPRWGWVCGCCETHLSQFNPAASNYAL